MFKYSMITNSNVKEMLFDTRKVAQEQLRLDVKEAKTSNKNLATAYSDNGNTFYEKLLCDKKDLDRLGEEDVPVIQFTIDDMRL